MFHSKEAREHVESFVDLIDYYSLVDNGIGFLKSGAYFAAWEIAGHDVSSQTLADQFYLANRFANGLNLGADFGFGCDVIRVPFTSYIEETSLWHDPVSFLIDEERRRQFAKPGNYFDNRAFFCLTYRPIEREGKASNWLFEAGQGEGEQGGDASRQLERFSRAVDELEALFAANLKSARRLRCWEKGGMIFDDLHRYVRFCIDTEDDSFPIPETAVNLNQLFATPLVPGDWPKLGDKYRAVVAINAFPMKSFAGILAPLLSMPFAYRFCQQAEILDTQQAVAFYTKKAAAWRHKKIPFLSKLIDKQNAQIKDKKAAQLEVEADDAIYAAEYQTTIEVFYTGKVILSHESLDTLREMVKDVRNKIKPFGSRHEESNAVAALVSSLPGHMHRDPRHSVVTTQNLAHFLPLGSPARGHRYHPSPYFPKKSPPHIMAATVGRSPISLCLHVQDTGHALVPGPIGNGKSTLLGHLAVQFLRYPGSRVIAFDKKASLYTLTKAVRGNFMDITPGKIQLCPLYHLDSPTEIAWGSRYVAFLCELNGLTLTPRNQSAIDKGILSIADSDPEYRSITDVQMQIDDDEVRAALDFFTLKSTSGGLLDGRRNPIAISRFTVFETDEMYKLDPRLVNAVLFSIFHEIERRANSAVPTLVLVDEFRKALQHPIAAKNFDEFLEEGRKVNIAVVLAIQSIQKILDSPLRSTILDSCKTKIILPNPNAATGEMADVYRELDLNDSDLEAIAGATPKRDYYWTSPEGNQIISLDCGNVFLAFMQSSDEDRALVDKMIARNPSGWQVDWLRHKGLDSYGWPTFLESLIESSEHLYAAVSA
jgi:type IV secretion/conjugal transfer VirB4 family ATPase